MHNINIHTIIKYHSYILHVTAPYLGAINLDTRNHTGSDPSPTHTSMVEEVALVWLLLFRVTLRVILDRPFFVLILGERDNEKLFHNNRYIDSDNIIV